MCPFARAGIVPHPSSGSCSLHGMCTKEGEDEHPSRGCCISPPGVRQGWQDGDANSQPSLFQFAGEETHEQRKTEPSSSSTLPTLMRVFCLQSLTAAVVTQSSTQEKKKQQAAGKVLPSPGSKEIPLH